MYKIFTLQSIKRLIWNAFTLARPVKCVAVKITKGTRTNENIFTFAWIKCEKLQTISYTFHIYVAKWKKSTQQNCSSEVDCSLFMWFYFFILEHFPLIFCPIFDKFRSYWTCHHCQKIQHRQPAWVIVCSHVQIQQMN